MTARRQWRLVKFRALRRRAKRVKPWRIERLAVTGDTVPTEHMRSISRQRFRTLTDAHVYVGRYLRDVLRPGDTIRRARMYCVRDDGERIRITLARS